MKNPIILRIKNELKDLSKKISQSRNAFKNSQREQGYGDWSLQRDTERYSWKFRHMHIAYCLLRGRTRDQIERPVKNFPDEGFISKLHAEYLAEVESFKSSEVVDEALCINS